MHSLWMIKMPSDGHFCGFGETFGSDSETERKIVILVTVIFRIRRADIMNAMHDII